MFELRQLRYFVTLADNLHFGRAAAQLHISQPPLSRQIAALEETLGVQLLVRNSRHVTLTPAGRHFHEQAQRIFQALDNAVSGTQAVSRGERGVLGISFTLNAAWNVVPPLMRLFGDAYPAVRIQLNEVLPNQLNESLLTGETDIGIAFPWQQVPGLEYLRLHSEPLCAALPAQHRLASQPSIDLAELANEPFVTFPAVVSPTLHELVIGSCRDHGFEPRIRLETRMHQTIVNLVAEGLGVSLVPESMGRMRLPGAVFLPLTRPRMVEQGALWVSGNNNPCLAPFLECATGFAQKSVAARK